jgi:hypothetical protein
MYGGSKTSVKGHFRGVRVKPVPRPILVVEGEYDTVRYGELQFFAIYAPPRSQRGDIGNTILIKVPDGGIYGFYISGGDEYTPNTARQISSEEVEVLLMKHEPLWLRLDDEV